MLPARMTLIHPHSSMFDPVVVEKLGGWLTELVISAHKIRTHPTRCDGCSCISGDHDWYVYVFPLLKKSDILAYRLGLHIIHDVL